MPIAILMPALSPTMTEGNIAKWLKSEGDKIISGDIIAEVETDKATMEVEAVEEGKLASIIFPDGSENVPVNKLIGVIALEGEQDQEVKNFIEKNIEINKDHENNKIEKIHDKKNEEINTEDKLVEIKKDINEGEIISKSKNKLISPLAKKIAELKGIDFSKVEGTGPKGRIVKKDLDKFYNTTDLIKADKVHSYKADQMEVIPLSNIRKTIANRLQEAKASIPHFYLKGKVQVDNLIKERSEINKFLIDNNINVKISFNDYFIKAIALCLKRVPEMNTIWNGDDTVTSFSSSDISVAVATKEGLFTPVVKNACTKSLETISKEVKQFAIKAKEGKLLPEDYTGGSFSISNLGMFGIDEFSAIINPPQSGIIAIGDIIDDVIAVDNEIKICKTMSYVISVDHRITDGATASRLLKYFNFFIKNPSSMLV